MAANPLGHVRWRRLRMVITLRAIVGDQQHTIAGLTGESFHGNALAYPCYGLWLEGNFRSVLGETWNSYDILDVTRVPHGT